MKEKSWNRLYGALGILIAVSVGLVLVLTGYTGILPQGDPEELADNLPQLFSTGVILVIGLLLLLAALAFWISKVPSALDLSMLAGFVLFCGLWFLIDYDSIGYLIPNEQVLAVMEHLTLCFIPLFLIGYLRLLLQGKGPGLALLVNFSVLLAVQTVNLALAVLGPGREDSDAYFWTQVVLLAASLLNAICCAVCEARRSRRRRDWIVAVVITLVFLALGADGLDYELTLITHGDLFHNAFLLALLVVLFGMLRYMVESIRQAHRASELEKELLQSRISVMLSQIKPHFIFNTLNAISALCLTDPLKADETVITFSEYLRGNINSLEAQAPIPFTQELRHVQNYVKIEQTRFGDRLRVEYDIAFSDFTIPTLTLQPIVENAIRHGIGKKEEGGTVWISAQRREDMAVLTVRDDGVGFDMEGEYKRKESIGMQNVQLRLAAMRGGSMQVQSRVGEGTVTTIEIPLNHSTGLISR